MGGARDPTMWISAVSLRIWPGARARDGRETAKAMEEERPMRESRGFLLAKRRLAGEPTRHPSLLPTTSAIGPATAAHGMGKREHDA